MMLTKRSQLFRVSVVAVLMIALTGCSGNSSDVAKGDEVTLEQAQKLIRTLFYDRQSAWNQGTSQGLYFESSHNYPGAFDAAASAQCAEDKRWVEQGLQESVTPDIGTVALDEEWVGPTSSENDWLFSGKKPEGQTFIVSVSTSTKFLNSEYSPAVVSDLHVTILNGKAYFYFGACSS